MAPEIVAPEMYHPDDYDPLIHDIYDFSADLWSVGIITYFLFFHKFYDLI